MSFCDVKALEVWQLFRGLEDKAEGSTPGTFAIVQTLVGSLRCGWSVGRGWSCWWRNWCQRSAATGRAAARRSQSRCAAVSATISPTCRTCSATTRRKKRGSKSTSSGRSSKSSARETCACFSAVCTRRSVCPTTRSRCPPVSLCVNEFDMAASRWWYSTASRGRRGWAVTICRSTATAIVCAWTSTRARNDQFQHRHRRRPQQRAWRNPEPEVIAPANARRH